jgi:hypothetical protein
MNDIETLPAYRGRVVHEHRDLTERIASLAAFINTPTYNSLPLAESGLLDAQLLHMRGYADVLRQRLGLWGVPCA